jgi:uncharacterized membrane protein
VLDAARHWFLQLSPLQQAAGLTVLTAIPWIELRGSIPLAIALGWHPVAAGILCALANCLIIAPSYAFLEVFYRRRLARYRIFRRLVDATRSRGASMVERYQLLGLALFVAVPFPGTGAYSGVALAWLLGLRRWPAMGAVALGVCGAGAAVTLVASGAMVALRRWI